MHKPSVAVWQCGSGAVGQCGSGAVGQWGSGAVGQWGMRKELQGAVTLRQMGEGIRDGVPACHD